MARSFAEISNFGRDYYHSLSLPPCLQSAINRIFEGPSLWSRRITPKFDT